MTLPGQIADVKTFGMLVLFVSREYELGNSWGMCSCDRRACVLLGGLSSA